MSKERPSQRPPRAELPLDPRVEPGTESLSLEEEVILPNRRRGNDAPPSRGRVVNSERRASTLPSSFSASPEDSEPQRRLAALYNELAEANETLARNHMLLTAERARTESLQEQINDIERKYKDALERVDDAEAKNSNLWLKIAGLERDIEANRGRNQALQNELEILHTQWEQSEQQRASLIKERDEASRLFEEACQETEVERQRRTSLEESIAAERAQAAKEREILELEHAAAILEAQREVRMEIVQQDESLQAEFTRKEAQQQAQHQEQLRELQERLTKAEEARDQALAAAAQAQTNLTLEQSSRAQARGVYESTIARIRTEHEQALRERDNELAQSRERESKVRQALDELEKQNWSVMATQLQQERDELQARYDQALKAQLAAEEKASAEERVMQQVSQQLQRWRANLASGVQEAQAALTTLEAALQGLARASEAGDQEGELATKQLTS